VRYDKEQEIQEIQEKAILKKGFLKERFEKTMCIMMVFLFQMSMKQSTAGAAVCHVCEAGCSGYQPHSWRYTAFYYIIISLCQEPQERKKNAVHTLCGFSSLSQRLSAIKGSCWWFCILLSH